MLGLLKRLLQTELVQRLIETIRTILPKVLDIIPKRLSLGVCLRRKQLAQDVRSSTHVILHQLHDVDVGLRRRLRRTGLRRATIPKGFRKELKIKS